jgi:hypothetical protein
VADRVGRHPLWAEQDHHRHCEHHDVHAPHDWPRKPRTHRAEVRVARERSVVGAENDARERDGQAPLRARSRTGRVTLAALCKLDYQFCYELRRRNGAINEAERLQRFLERARQDLSVLWPKVLLVSEKGSNTGPEPVGTWTVWLLRPNQARARYGLVRPVGKPSLTGR